MPSSSADRTAPRRGAGPAPERRAGRRLLLAALLVAAALTGPAVGYASARFGDTARVTISVRVSSSGSPSPSPSPSASAAAGQEPAGP